MEARPTPATLAQRRASKAATQRVARVEVLAVWVVATRALPRMALTEVCMLSRR